MSRQRTTTVLLFFVFLCHYYSTQAALPPGFDEEVYCPDRMCLRKRQKIQRGFTGPRAMFLECFNPSTKETCRPRVWGVKLDREYRDSLLRDKWHMEKCPEEKEARELLLNEYFLLGSRLDTIIETLAVLSFI